MTFNSPWDQPAYKKPKRKKVAKKAKKVARKKVTKKAKKKPGKLSYPHAGGPQGADRSQGRVPYGGLSLPGSRPGHSYKEGGKQMPDPKADARSIHQALSEVGSTKKKVSFPKKGAYLTVAYGVGVDSTAILIGLDQLWRSTRMSCFVPMAITFADTGGEKPDTYAYLHRVNRWLKSAFRGAPSWAAREVTVVAWTTEHTAKGYGTGYTLEISEILKQYYPSIAYGRSGCSAKFKVEPQENWLLQQIEQGVLPRVSKGKRLVRAIGYDATETSRLEGAGTYASKNEEKKGFLGWYPLMEWGWDRARCIAEIAVAFGSKSRPNWKAVPKKSSCTFCSGMKPEEIVMLGEDYPELLERAIFLEHVARIGHGKKASKSGLGKAYFWADFATANFDKLGHRQRVVIWGGVVRDNPKQQTTLFVGDPREYPRELGPKDRVVPPCGQIMSAKRLKAIQGQAEKWVRAVKNVKKGTKDLSLHPMASKLLAFTSIHGFRGCAAIMAWDRLLEDLGPQAEYRLEEAKKEADAAKEEQKLKAYEVAHERAVRSAKKLRTCRRVAANPPYPRSPMIDPTAMLTNPACQNCWEAE